MANQNQQQSNQPTQPTTPQEPTAPQEPIIPQQPQPKPKLPSWASILIIVIAAIIVVGLVSWAGYELFKPAPSKLPEAGDVEEDEFKDWKTYQNEKYGWEIQYPGDMLTKAVINRVLGEGKEFLVLDIGTKEYINRLDAEYGPGKGLCGEGFSFSVHLIACKSGVYRRDDFVGTMYKDYKQSGTIDINGTSVPKYEGSLQMFDTPVPGMYFDFLNKDNSMAYLIQAEFCSSENKNLIEKIITTFKFIE